MPSSYSLNINTFVFILSNSSKGRNNVQVKDLSLGQKNNSKDMSNVPRHFIARVGTKLMIKTLLVLLMIQITDERINDHS